MRKFYFLIIALFISIVSIAQQVTLTATGGTGTGTFTTLKGAFDAINAGTHTGAIVISINANTTESATAVLNSSGAGTASYTSILIQPTVDAVSISGASASGRGVIELNGADNVTIDGDNPNSAGTNKDLTIINTATATTTYAAVIRISTNTTGATSADNNIVRNCNLTGNASGRNLSTATSTTGSENTTFGIYVGGYASTTSTGTPVAIASVTTNTTTSGCTANNTTISNNAIIQCGRGIVFNGSAATFSTGVTITNNTIGSSTALTGTPPYTSPSSTVYTKGIWVAGSTAVTITGNTLRSIVSYVATTTNGIELNAAVGAGGVTISNNTITGVVCNTTSSAYGIQVLSSLSNPVISNNTITGIQAIGSSGTGTVAGIALSHTGTAATVSNNIISTVYQRTAGGYPAIGINIVAGNAITIQNNFISDINAPMSNGALTTQYGTWGIRITAGLNHRVYHNSVNLSGALLAGSSTFASSAALVITANTLTGIDVRNNIFSNTLTGAPASSNVTSIMLPSGATSAMNLTLNNNAYYEGTGVGAGIAQVGITTGSGLYSAANFIASATAPATNLRSYTSTLSATGSNDGASLAFSSAAPFVSATDLHLNLGTTPTQLESSGASLGVTTDIDGQTRPGPAGSTNGGATAPDLGADEFDGVPLDLTAPSISYTPLAFTCASGSRTLTAAITDGSGVPTSGAGLPVLYWNINGGAYQAATGTYVSGSNYSFTFGAGAVLGDVVNYYIVAQDNATTPNVVAVPSTGAAGYTTNPPAASTPPTTPSSYSINGTLSGIYTVGASGTYPTLTAAIADYNSKCLTGPVTFSLIDALYSASETFPIVINPNTTASATNTLTIKPAAGVTAEISGLISTTAVLVSNGADYITIDGSNTTSGVSRDLTIRHLNTTTNGTVTVWVASQGVGAGAVNNVIKNTIIEGPGSGTSTTVNFALFAGSNTGSANGPDNDNLTIQNNLFRKAYYGIQALGSSLAKLDGFQIIGNEFGSSTSAEYIGKVGMVLGEMDGALVKGNSIFNLITTNTNPTGLALATGAVNSTIDGNIIRAIRYTGTGGYGGKGIDMSTGTLTSNLTISNNMISDIRGDGWSSLTTDGIVGLRILNTTGGVKLYYNTVNLGSGSFAGNTSGTLSAALYIPSSAVGMDIRNNSFSTNLVNSAAAAAKSYAIYSAAPSSAFTTINNNNYSVSGTQGVLGYLSTDQTTLAAVQTAFGQNTQSVNAAPSFVSANDNLHLTNALGDNLCLNGKATPITGITTDIDGNTRDASTPDIGADEFAPTLPTFVTTAQSACFGQTVNLTAAGVTAGSTAGQTFTYFTDAALTTAVADPTAVGAGTYYIKATYTSGGCSIDQVQSVTVTINALPSVSIVVAETSGTTANDGTICAGDAATLTAGGATSYTWAPGGATTAAITVNPTTTTAYTVTGTDANGCQNTASTTITVNALPVASITVAETSGTTNNDGTICAGASASLTAFGGTSYSWSNGATTAAITVSPATTTTYTVTVTDGNGCSSTASVTITVDALPTTYNVTGGGPYCSGGVGSSIGLSGSDVGVSYELYAGATATGNIVIGAGSAFSFGTITTAGTYTVVASNAATGCSATMSGSATVSVAAVPTISYVLNQPNNCNSNNGGAALTLGGAAGPYTFNWTGAGIIQGQQDQTTLRVGAYTVVVTAANGCQATANFSLIGPGGCDICPTIGAVSATPAVICQGGTATLSATGLADLGISYGIEFVGSSTPLANPYNGGTSLATVANGSLVPVGTLASATATVTFNTPGINYIYAILLPAPADPACRPSKVFQLNVVETPSVNTVSNQTVCSGGATAAVNFTGSVAGTVYNWTNSDPSIGLAASGTGNIASFTATNFTNAPVTSTITVTPVNNFSSTGGKFMILESEGGVPNTLRNQLLALPNVSQVDIFDGRAGTPTLAQMQQYGTIVCLTNYDYLNPTAVGDLLADYIDGGGKVVATDWSWSGCCGSIQGRWLSGGYSPFNFPASSANFARSLGTFTPGHPLMQGVSALYTEFGMTSTLTSGTTLVASYNDGSPAVAVKGSSIGISGHPGDEVFTCCSPTAWSGDFARIIYNASSSASGSASCPGTPKTFTITVNPIPTVNTVAPVAACNGATVNVPFTGFVPGTVYSWTNSNTAIGLAASGTGNLSFTGTNSGTTPITGNIIVTPSYTNNGQTCTGTPVAFTITINPTPTVNTVSNQVVCNSGSTTAVNFSGAVTGTVYNWTNSNASIGLAASGTGNIASFTAVNTGTAPVTSTITVTPTYTNGGTTCSGTATTFTITVNPSAQVNSVTNQTVCNGANTTAVTFGTNNTGGTTTYSWTNNTPSIGLAASGTGNIAAFAAVNTGTSPVTATITVTPSYTSGGETCSGTAITFTITVNPTPTVNAVSSEVVCNGSSTSAVTFSGAVTGTVYNWTNSNTAIGLAASGTGNIAAFTATNTTSAPITATITVTPSYTNGGVTCTGTSTSYTITVNPTPTVNTVSNQTLCNGAATTAVTFSGAVTGTVYTWSNNTPSIGLAASGTGNIASFTATNTTSAPVTATITVTPSFLNGGTLCTGTPRTFTITVNPTPTVVATPASQTICSANAITTIALTGTVTGTTYSWTRDNTTSVTGIAASGTGNISGILTNTTNAPVTVTFTITPSANGCTGTPITATVLVNPTPNAVATPAAQTICSGSAITTIALTGNVAGTTYSWTRNNTTAVTGIAASGSGNITGTLTNTTTAPVTVTFTITPSANGCTGTPITATVIVNPIPTVNQPASQVVCDRSNTTAVAFTGTVTGTVYSWTNNTPSIGLAASGTGDIAAFTAVNTTQTPVVATITVTPSFTNGGVTCTGTPRTFTITVNPTPIVVATDLFNQRICISDGPVALNATPVGGSWSGIGVSGFNFIPSATAVGNFLLTYTYTNQFGCTSTDTTTAKVSACDERNRSLEAGGAILYPNPNGGQFNIRVNSTRFQFLQMRIYNALGQLVSTKQWNGLVYGQILPVDMRHLAAGVYTVRVIYDGGNLYEDRGYQMLITH